MQQISQQRNPPDMDSVIHVTGNQLGFAGKKYHCAIGKGGFSPDKKEGDGCTPLGIFPLRELWCRADKFSPPKTNLPIKIINKNDGWCDDPKSSDYNRHVLMPYDFSHEELWREDDVYDLIIPIGYNDKNIIAGAGSAIFIHVARDNYTPTEGCIALKKEDLLEILPYLSANTHIEIK